MNNNNDNNNKLNAVWSMKKCMSDKIEPWRNSLMIVGRFVVVYLILCVGVCALFFLSLKSESEYVTFISKLINHIKSWLGDSWAQLVLSVQRRWLRSVLSIVGLCLLSAGDLSSVESLFSAACLSSAVACDEEKENYTFTVIVSII